MYEGSIENHDATGNCDIINKGEVQWITTGSGVLHKESHEVKWAKEGGFFQMVQLWVNLPLKNKMTPPKYQRICGERKTIVPLENGGRVEIIAGEYKGNKGPADTFSPMHIMNVQLNTHGKAHFSFPADFTTLALVLKGEICINTTHTVTTDQLALFEKENEEFSIEATENAVVLLLSGQPLGEPIIAYGPFVMNTQEEIMQAFDDFNLGKFGYLED